ncbi:MAG: hypothetical protein M3440_03825, partial [Chloroflexota bacterium]|nr:hypothetical protein [Chloroflexota bacterium]
MVTHTELVVTSTGELLPVLDTDNTTALQIEQWLHGVKDAVRHMTTIDELNQAEAMLTAVARRLKQLDKDASEAERVRIFAFRQIGELLGPAEFGRNNPNGSNQYAKVDK